MNLIQKEVSEDIYKIVENYSNTVILEYDSREEKNCNYIVWTLPNTEHATIDPFNKDLLMYLDSIQSSCITHTLEIMSYNVGSNLINYGSVQYYRCHNGRYLYNITKKYCIEINKTVFDDDLHTIHSDIIDYYQKYNGKYGKFYLRYIPNNTRIIKLDTALRTIVMIENGKIEKIYIREFNHSIIAIYLVLGYDSKIKMFLEEYSDHAPNGYASPNLTILRRCL